MKSRESSPNRSSIPWISEPYEAELHEAPAGLPEADPDAAWKSDREDIPKSKEASGIILLGQSRRGYRSKQRTSLDP